MKINLSKKTASILVATLAILCTPSALFAVNHTWDGPPGGGVSNDWFDAANWNNPGADTVPNSGDNVQISNTGTARIAGVGAAFSATLVLGNGVGESGTLQVGDTSSLRTFGDFIVGNAGTGTVVIRDAAKVVNVGTDLIIGRQTGALGSVDVTGTFSGPGGNDFNLTSDNNTIVGDSSELDNTLDIHNGGRVATGNNAIIGNNEGSNGRVRVGDDGPNSESYWFIQNNLAVGDAGTGDFRIRDGGFAGTFDGSTSIGRQSTGVGTMSVGGAGMINGPSLFTTNNMFVGDGGDGRLEIRDVGLVMANGNIIAGNQGKSRGRIDVSGSYFADTSDFNMTSSGDTVIGRAGDGGMDIHDGGRVHTLGAGFVGEDDGGTGVVRVGGDGPNSEAFWLIGRQGNIAAGIDAATSSIAGNAPSGNPSILVVGNNSGSNGTLFIHDGGLVNVDDGSGDAFVGRFAGSMGRVSIDGSGIGFQTPPNSTLIADDIYIGGNAAGPGGDGAMRLTNGGRVSADTLTVWGPGSGNKGLLEVDSTYIIEAGITFDGGRLRFLDDTDFTNDAFLGNTQSPDGIFVDTNGTTSTISGVLSGPGGLVKRDDGTLIIPAGTADTYTGNTRVREGTLQLDGSINSNTFVETNGTLTGTGTINANLDNHGIVSPGHSPGTLFVIGNFVNHTDGEFIAEVGGLNAGVESDLLFVGGTATIEGGTITVPRINNFNPVPGDRVTVIGTLGGRTGTFDTFNPIGWFGLIQPMDDYSNPFTVDIVFELTDTFASQGLTRNEICVGENLDAAVLLVNDNEAAHNLIGIIGQIPPEELPEVFNLLAPEELASIYEISFQHGIMEMDNYRQRMGDLRATARGYCGDLVATQPMASDGKTVLDGKQTLPDKNVAPVESCPDKRWGMFATGYGQGINVDDDEFNDVHGYDIVTGGFSTGFDALVTRNFAIGIGGGYAASTADLVNDGRVDAETGYVAAYATAFFGGFYVDAAATGGWSTYDTSRLGFGAFENGSTNGSEFNGIVGAGYDWKANCWTIGPFATFHYTYVELDSFDEDGGSIAPLHFPEQSQDAERGSVGLKVAYDMSKPNIIFRPEVRAAFQHEFNNTDYAIDWSFRDISDDHICSVFGPSTGENSALINAGFSLILGKCHNLSVYAFYNGNIGRENDTRNGATGGLRLSF